jgi:hypothetical protein
VGEAIVDVKEGECMELFMEPARGAKDGESMELFIEAARERELLESRGAMEAGDRTEVE